MSPRGDRMELDEVPKEELKIRGQAEVEKGRINDPDSKEIDLKRRESELKEKALRNKIVRNREQSTADAR